jgi:RimJ/RimL family protein N-acetyltransferase
MPLAEEWDPSTGLPVGPALTFSEARRPARQRLEGRSVRLEPLDATRHADDLFAATRGPAGEALYTYLFYGPFSDPVVFAADLAAKAQTDDPLFFALVDVASGKAVGHASFLRIAPRDGVIEVGHILYAPSLQRTVAATEAMYLMAKHVFDDLGYRRYEWKCNALNEPSRSAALRLGFTFEGVFRQHMVVKGRNRDSAWYSMLDSEWPASKAAFERWLDPANFDAAGRQKRSLSACRPTPSAA